MSKIDKPIAKIDSQQVLKEVYNDNEESLAVSSFIDSKIGARIVKTNVNATTETYSFYDGAVLLKTIQIVYTDSTKADLASVERTA
jgi:hypothetical protein